MRAAFSFRLARSAGLALVQLKELNEKLSQTAFSLSPALRAELKPAEGLFLCQTKKDQRPVFMPVTIRKIICNIL